MRIIAVIPARGGSKSIPGKNIKILHGHPLIAYSIAAARQSKDVDRIICSTDDPGIAEIAKNYGAEIPFIRPKEISGDEVTDYPVFEHVISALENEIDDSDILLHLRPTSPFRPIGLLHEGIKLLQLDPSADSVRSVSLTSQNPYKMWTVEEGVIKPLIKTEFYESYNMPRQLLPVTYWHNGLLDVVRVSCLRNKNSISGSRILPLYVDNEYAIDLDTEEEWAMAERIMSSTSLSFVQP